MKIIEGNTINEIALKSWDLILNSGATSTNRNSAVMGGISAEYDVSLIWENPRARHLYLDGRKNNIFATLAEIFWVMAGREDTEYLMNFIPRANDFSDDQKTWRAAYGSRMYEYGQLSSLIDKFTSDGLYTRQAMLTLWHPEKDTKDMLKEKYGLDKTKDTPCNQWLQFWVDARDNKLNMKVIQRSGDAIWGTLNINLPEFSVLHEFVLQMVNKNYPEVTLGSYNHSVTNFHIYDATSQQAKDALSNTTERNFIENEKISVFPETLDSTKMFFNEICELILTGSTTDNIELLFAEFNVPTENNIIFDYVVVVNSFLKSKNSGFKNANKSKNIVIPECCLTSKDFIDAVNQSPFRNFCLIENCTTTTI